MISATRTYPRCSGHTDHNDATTDPLKCYTISTTTETTNPVVLTCKGSCCMNYVSIRGSVKEIPATVKYTYVIQAESVYNGTKATITIEFNT